MFPYREKKPVIHKDALILPGAQVHSDVHIGAWSTVWFNSVIRGDVHEIRIGERTNIQDLCLVHNSEGVCPTIIGNGVTVGHNVIAHGCEIGNDSLIGMGTTLLDRCRIGDNVMIGAGSLVTEGKEIPSGVLAFGRPAKVIRELTEEEFEFIRDRAQHYVDLGKTYRS